MSDRAAQFRRSGFVLLRQDGWRCTAGEPLAFCSVQPAPQRRSGTFPRFEDEELYDLYALVLAPCAGVLRWKEGISEGGWMDTLAAVNCHTFAEPTVIGTIESEKLLDRGPLDTKILILNGRRAAPWADHRGTLLPGWYDRMRAWSFSGQLESVIIAATCLLRPPILGEDRSFSHLFTSLNRPLHLTYLPETVFIPSSRMLLDELLHTPGRRAEILDELHSWIPLCRGGTGSDIAFIGSLIERVRRGSPLRESAPVFQQGVEGTVPSPRLLVLTADGDDAANFRHKRLHFRFSLPHYVVNEFRPCLRKLFETRFEREEEPTPRVLTTGYRMLSGILKKTGTELVVANSVVVEHGSPLLRPGQGDRLRHSRSYKARARNEMLAELAEGGVLSLLDVDAVAASIGTRNVLDGGHGNGRFAAAVRQALVEQLQRRLTYSGSGAVSSPMPPASALTSR